MRRATKTLKVDIKWDIRASAEDLDRNILMANTSLLLAKVKLAYGALVHMGGARAIVPSDEVE